jgi:hypothetical protein
MLDPSSATASELRSGWLPLISLLTDSYKTYGINRKKLPATHFCARRSAVSENRF